MPKHFIHSKTFPFGEGVTATAVTDEALALPLGELSRDQRDGEGNNCQFPKVSVILSKQSAPKDLRTIVSALHSFGYRRGRVSRPAGGETPPLHPLLKVLL